MDLIYSDEHAKHHCQGEMKDGQFVPCFERPERLDIIRQALATQHLDVRAPDIADPLPAILNLHDPAYVDFLQTIHDDWIAAGRSGDVLPLVWPGRDFRHDLKPKSLGMDGRIGLMAFDGGSPICAGTWEAMLSGARCALTAADAVLEGETLAASLSRPPGHHAMRGQYGGYCYVNFAGLAAERLRAGGAKRIAVLDVDYHHGNGTQSLFYQRADILVVNIHADTAQEYPYYLGHADERGTGAGDGTNLNLPLDKGTTWTQYHPALEAAITAVRGFKADALVLSFGGDTFMDDPLGKFMLDTPDYARMGRAIASLGLPTVLILEGGYAIDALGANLLSLLNGLAP